MIDFHANNLNRNYRSLSVSCQWWLGFGMRPYHKKGVMSYTTRTVFNSHAGTGMWPHHANGKHHQHEASHEGKGTNVLLGRREPGPGKIQLPPSPTSLLPHSQAVQTWLGNEASIWPRTHGASLSPVMMNAEVTATKTCTRSRYTWHECSNSSTWTQQKKGNTITVLPGHRRIKETQLLTTLLDPLEYQHHELKGHFLLKNNLSIITSSTRKLAKSPHHSTPSFHCLQYVWKQKGTCAASRSVGWLPEAVVFLYTKHTVV